MSQPNPTSRHPASSIDPELRRRRRQEFLSVLRRRQSVQNTQECFIRNPVIRPESLEEASHQSVDPPYEESDSNSERIGNTHWCQCGFCVPMTTGIESICCHDVPQIVECIPDEKICVTEHNFFKVHCTEREEVLWMYRNNNTHLQRLPCERDLLRALRKTAYRSFTVWIYGFLGKRVRKPIPSCVVKEIRNAFPDPHGRYLGFILARDIYAEHMVYDSE